MFVVSLREATVHELAGLFTRRSLCIIVLLLVLGIVAASAAGVATLESTLRWFSAGATPDEHQRMIAARQPIRQSAILMVIWLSGGAIFVLLNCQYGWQGAVFVISLVIFGGVASVCTGLLRTQRTLRPLATAAAHADGDCGTSHRVGPGLETRLVIMWLLCGVLPCAGIVGLVVARSRDWVIRESADLEVPMLVFSLAALPLGLRAVALVSRSIRDPIREVISAMSLMEQDVSDITVDVYDRAEIGRLQSGFNKMVTAAKERDRLRNLFGRYVGEDVARLAVREQDWTSGNVLDVAVLFVDLVGSTRLAATRPPAEVAEVINAFLRIVVSAVHESNGLINKFQGDAALAVFGAPLQNPDSASAAMTTARILTRALRGLPEVDFGIGVAAGTVFAGNIGAESRYEYTVIGDPVNEACRLADTAKTSQSRVLGSVVAFNRADATERQHWTPCGSTLLRGRSTPTLLVEPKNPHNAMPHS